MTISMLSRAGRLHVPAQWPPSVHPQVLEHVTHPTPYLMCDLGVVRDRYRRLTTALDGFRCFYAMKCNSASDVLVTLAEMGCGFEVASMGELEILQQCGLDPRDVLYSNTVKPPTHVAAAHAAGLWRFAFDSEQELYKLAHHAPGCAVTLRLRVDDSLSTFPLSRKFGADPADGVELMALAQLLGLRPYGLTFHVGSQCASPLAWRQALTAAGRVLTDLFASGTELEMLDIGGGFPARYLEDVPSIEQIAEVINDSVHELLPYRPPLLAAEPGRYLVAESAVLAAGVLGQEVRAGENWLYLDVGAYNGLIETQQTVGQWRYPLWSSRPDHAVAQQTPYTVTGPSCDSSDTMFHGVMLPRSLEVDDRVYIGCAGAYTLSYASRFNGFPPPACLYVGAR